MSIIFIIDCPDKSDEVGCPSCRPDQFRCQSGECIEKSFVCDGTIQVNSAYFLLLLNKFQLKTIFHLICSVRMVMMKQIVANVH